MNTTTATIYLFRNNIIEEGFILFLKSPDSTFLFSYEWYKEVQTFGILISISDSTSPRGDSDAGGSFQGLHFQHGSRLITYVFDRGGYAHRVVPHRTSKWEVVSTRCTGRAPHETRHSARYVERISSL